MTIISKPTNKKYREGWDRIFGTKEESKEEQISELMRKRYEEETGKQAFSGVGAEHFIYNMVPTWEYCRYLEKKVLELETSAV